MTEPDLAALRQAMSELRDSNKERRRTAVMKLGMMGGDEAVRVLIFTVRNPTEDLIVRGRAALMLGKLGDPRAVDPLIEALDEPASGFQTRMFAAESLGKLGDRRAISALLRASEEDGEKIREAAQNALNRLGYESPPPAANAHEASEPLAEGEA
ncbi:MAG: HEAT repeat domain-containing protein [Anaerolineae bacterium]|nr:HEAT repeat domain-containing protein [Anaerolineae bacterium]